MRKAFTLIELLVVVAIIAVLISILLPSLSRARKQARQVACASNQRNVAMALFMYADDNQGYHHAVWANRAPRFEEFYGRRRLLPPYELKGGRKLTSRAYWAAMYDGYLVGKTELPSSYYSGGGAGLPRKVKSLEQWENTRCPEAKYTIKAFRTPAGSDPLPHDPYTLWSTYSFNGITPSKDGIPDGGTPTFFEAADPESYEGGRRPTKIYTIKFPSEIILFHDGSEVMMDGNGDTLIQMDQKDWAPEAPAWEDEYYRHPGGSMVTWTDGHVEAFSRKRGEAERERMLERGRGTGTSRTGNMRLRYYSARS